MSAEKIEKKPRGRPSSFNRVEILEVVMNLFWDHGYNKLSFNEIAVETGLTRASLYNAFETKEALFLEALQHYFKSSVDKNLRDLKPGELVGPALYETLKNAAQIYVTDKQKRGCMGVNCFNELIGKDTHLSVPIGKIYEEYKKSLKSLIRQAIEQNELPCHTDAEITANMVLVFMNGFSIFTKSKTTKKTLDKMALDFLQKLGFKI